MLTWKSIEVHKSVAVDLNTVDDLPFELTIPSNGCENVKCTSMWSFAHITSSETIFGIPFGRSVGHNSLAADTKLNCKSDKNENIYWRCVIVNPNFFHSRQQSASSISFYCYGMRSRFIGAFIQCIHFLRLASYFLRFRRHKSLVQKKSKELSAFNKSQKQRDKCND